MREPMYASEVVQAWLDGRSHRQIFPGVLNSTTSNVITKFIERNLPPDHRWHRYQTDEDGKRVCGREALRLFKASGKAEKPLRLYGMVEHDLKNPEPWF